MDLGFYPTISPWAEIGNHPEFYIIICFNVSLFIKMAVIAWISKFNPVLMLIVVLWLLFWMCSAIGWATLVLWVHWKLSIWLPEYFSPILDWICQLYVYSLFCKIGMCRVGAHTHADTTQTPSLGCQANQTSTYFLLFSYKF